MTITTKSQLMAQAAWKVAGTGKSKEYASFAREFPTLVHSCGLAQAVAFAQAKKNHQVEYLNDLVAVLNEAGEKTAGTLEGLERFLREEEVVPYIRLSRTALAAAVWIKRYVEAGKGATDA